MKNSLTHTKRSDRSFGNFIVLLPIIIFFAAPAAIAQNTKGDKPAKQSPIIRFPKIKRHSKGGDHPYTRDISGRGTIRQKNKDSESHIVYSNSNPASRQKGTRSRDRAATRRFKVKVRSVSAQRARNNVYSQNNKFVSNPAKRPSNKPRTYSRTASGKAIVRSYPNNNQRAWIGNLKGGANGAPSISRSWVTRGRKNVYWGKFSKGERPMTRDLTGRTVRTLNFHSAPISSSFSDIKKPVLHKPSLEGANFGKIRGGYSSISDRNGRAWTGDISGRALRRRLAGQARGGRGLFGGLLSASGRNKSKRSFGGYRSASGKYGSNQSLPVRRPGIGAGGIAKMLRRQGGKGVRGGGPAEEVGGFKGNIPREELFPSYSPGGLAYSGDIKRKKPTQGGGSISGSVFNNGGQPLRPRGPGGAAGIGSFSGNLLRQEASTKGYGRDGSRYSGDIKAGRPFKGGGSVSGKVFNNGGQPLSVRRPGSFGMGAYKGNLLSQDVSSKGFSRDGSRYSGDIKAGRPSKGGGSVSGQFFGHNGKPLQGKRPGNGSLAIGTFRGHISKDELEPQLDRGLSGYSGDMRARRPAKGGGSISGKYLSNGGKPVRSAPPGKGSWGIPEFQGNIRAYRPLKGGGSVSGKYMSYNGKPLQVRPPGRDSWGIPGFQGNIKSRKPAKGGGSISGIVWNNHEKPITVRGPVNGDINNYSGKMALSRFKKYYVRNPHASDDALKKRKPGPSTYIIGGLTAKTRQPNYVRNPSSNAKSLKTWSPGVAYARLKDYQGNQKMSKPRGARLHPDSQFAHGNRDNVKSERSLKTNIKLLWARLFKKSGGQPEIVKEKQPVPRYDRKEKELWKALYD